MCKTGLGESTDIFRVLSDNSPNMIFINDFHKVVYANLICTTTLGYTNEELLSSDFNFLDLIHPSYHDSIKEAFNKHKQGLDIEPYEYKLLTKTGKCLDVVISTKLVTWNGKNAILGTVTDISEYKRLEKQLRDSEEKYVLFLDSSMDAVFGVKGDKFVYANKRAVEMLGYDSLDELLSVSILDIVAPEHRDMVADRTQSRLVGENPPNRYEVILQRKDGCKEIVEFNISSIEFEGDPMNLTVARNISDMVRHRNRLTALLGHAVKLSSASDMEEIVQFTLDTMEEALDFQYSSFLELDDDKLVIRSKSAASHGLALPLTGTGLTVRAFNTKRSILVNDTRLDPDYIEGYFHSLSELDVPILLGNEAVGVLNVEGKTSDMFSENDIQMLKLLAIHVSSAIDRLNKQNEVESLRQDQFNQLIEGYRKTSASVRHDLRSPLMTIINAVNVLNIRPDNQQMKDILMVKTKFIETVLEDWKYLTYSGELNRIDVSVSSLIDNVVNTATVPDTIEIRLDVDRSTIFNLDNNSMIRVLSNLVKNSVEAIDASGVISISSKQDADGLTLKVMDDGVGIKPEDLPKIFTPFYTTKEGGTGIGLSYVKEIIEAHGGDVCVSSDTGTTVTMHIPYPHQ